MNDLNGGRPGGGSDDEKEEVDPAAAKVVAGPPMMRNLSNREYVNAISDLLGEKLPSDLDKAWTPTTQFSGFDAVPWTNLDTKAVRDRAETLEAILDRAVASPKVMTCNATTPEALAYAGCPKNILEPFAKRAFGRPLTAAETGGLQKTYDAAVVLAKTALTDNGEIFKDGVRAAIGSVLLSPQLLTRSELPPKPDFTGERELNAYELASRISFMLIASIPDDALWAKAEDGTLVQQDVLLSETERLLDRYTDTFVKGFMGQWFDFRTYDIAAAGSIEESMYGESWRTLSEVVKQDLPVTAVLTPGFTFVNDALAKHYGIAGTFGKDFQRVDSADRGGVLQSGSWLSTSATPLKTSPMHRGRLVQDRLLCKVIPPPSSELFAQIQMVTDSIPQTASVKERVEVHRKAGDACKGCHEYMDPIGIGLEGFDPTGKLRATYTDGKPVQTDSNLLGKPFGTFQEMNGMLAALPDYQRCASEKLTVYSLKRIVDGTKDDDKELLTYLSMPTDAHAPSFRDMMLRLVKSAAFRKVVHGGKI